MSETHASAQSSSTFKPWKFPKPGGRGGGKTSIDMASYYMLCLYRTNLETRFQAIDEAALETDNQRKIYSTVRDMLQAVQPTERGTPNLEWDEVYKLERLIALLFNGLELRQEISRRLHELAAGNLADADTFRREYEALLKPSGEGPCPAPPDGIFRTFLLRVLEAIHWSAKKKYLAGPIRKEATKNILWCLLVAFALLVVPYIYLNIDYSYEPQPSSTMVASAAVRGIDASGIATDADIRGTSPAVLSSVPAAGEHKVSLSKWWSMFSLWTALTAGLLGASFSRLIMVQRQWSTMTLEDVFLHRELSYSLLRAGVGVCGALIVYFFLRSGIAEGALFPDFSKVAIEWVSAPAGALPMTFVAPSKALALLTFWCFLAGFSEALVPSILSNTERQLTDATARRSPA
jgi:hypothetical protein